MGTGIGLEIERNLTENKLFSALDNQINSSVTCINQQEKQKDFNGTINISDLKSCVSDSQNLTKNEFKEVLEKK